MTRAPALLAALLGLAALALGAPAPAAAYCLMTTSTEPPTPEMPCVMSGLPLAWDRACISYSIDTREIDPAFVPTFRDAVVDSFGAWLAVECGGSPVGFAVMETAEESLCDAAQFRTRLGNVNTISYVATREDWIERDYSPSAFAVTTVWHSPETGEIFDADLLINAAMGPYDLCPDGGCSALPCDQRPRSTPVDVQSVLTHELGHFFGIGHSEDVNATMYATDCRGDAIKRTLAQDDVDALCAAYEPGALPATCDYEPLGGLDVECAYGVSTTSKGGRCSFEPGPTPGGLPSSALVLGLAALVARRRGRRRPTRASAGN